MRKTYSLKYSITWYHLFCRFRNVSGFRFGQLSPTLNLSEEHIFLKNSLFFFVTNPSTCLLPPNETWFVLIVSHDLNILLSLLHLNIDIDSRLINKVMIAINADFCSKIPFNYDLFSFNTRPFKSYRRYLKINE